jgi:PAS domain S-box-containing protein
LGTNVVGLTGQPVLRLFHAEEACKRAAAAHSAALRGHRRSFAAAIQGRELQVYVEPLREPNGGILGAIGLAIDSTERLVSERALRISERNYRSLIEEAPSAIFRSTLSGALLQVNRAMIEMLGYDAASQSELLMRDLPQIFACGGFEEFRRAIDAKPVLQGFEGVWTRRDGSEIQVSLSCSVLRDERGAPSHLDGLASDITEKKHLEAQLGHAQRMQAAGQLAGGVAHDFNNLLTIIAGHVEMMLMKQRDEDLRGRLVAVQEAAERATVLTRQLLAFSRKQVLQTREVEVNGLIAKLTAMLGRLIKENIRVTFLAGPDAGYVRADPHQIEQVLMNLAVNAQDAMPQGGHLTIETAYASIQTPPLEPDDPPRGEYVKIVVRDTGHGMDWDTRQHIFEPFFTTKAVGAGTGLGLSMAYGIVRQSGGRILVDSAPGRGATFTVYLPRVAEAAPAVEEIHPRSSQPKGNETILVAEDETAVRELVVTYLSSLGYTVLAAGDGNTALHLAETHDREIHLLLTDFVMPQIGGKELAAGVRARFPNMKVVMMSGYSGQEDEIAEPGTFFLAKPLSMGRLAKMIREALGETACAQAG